MLREKLQVLIFDDNKNVIEDAIIAPVSENIGYHILKGTWHKVVSFECRTVCFETRKGPYSL